MIHEKKQEILDRLYALHRFGIKPGLERTQALLAHVGNPERHLRCIHVAGTNGKGSVCSMLASVLYEQGYTVGLYTSPHIHNFNERIRINGEMISDELIVQYAEELFPHVDAIGATFFEVTTVMAFMHFARSGVNCAVIETGLGGRFDSTNVLTPLVSVISSIDLDHQEYLGDTLEAIAGEKAGIIKPGVPVIIGEPRKELRHVFLEQAEYVRAPIYFVDEYASCTKVRYEEDLSMTMTLQCSLGYLVDVNTAAAGEHQQRNVLMVVECLKLIEKEFPCRISAIKRGLMYVRKNTGLKGRIEKHLALPLILDVGHNPACLRQLVRTLALCGYAATRWNVVFGVMADKEYKQMLRILQPITQKLFACAPDNERALPAEQLHEAALSLGISSQCCDSVAHALRECLDAGEPTLVVGSFYVAEEVLGVFGE